MLTPGYYVLGSGGPPKVRHATIAIAVNESIRLARLHQTEFHVIEVLGTAAPREAPTTYQGNIPGIATHIEVAEVDVTLTGPEEDSEGNPPF